MWLQKMRIEPYFKGIQARMPMGKFLAARLPAHHQAMSSAAASKPYGQAQEPAWPSVIDMRTYKYAEWKRWDRWDPLGRTRWVNEIRPSV